MIRTLMILAAVLSLGLTACGKKGPLDPPDAKKVHKQQSMP
jgi:predicted small lipoprotein YifL